MSPWKRLGRRKLEMFEDSDVRSTSKKKRRSLSTRIVEFGTDGKTEYSQRTGQEIKEEKCSLKEVEWGANVEVGKFQNCSATGNHEDDAVDINRKEPDGYPSNIEDNGYTSDRITMTRLEELEASLEKGEYESKDSSSEDESDKYEYHTQLSLDENRNIDEDDSENIKLDSVDNMNRVEFNRSMVTENTIISIIFLSGPHRLKRKQYKTVRNLLRIKSCEVCNHKYGRKLPCISTYHSKVQKFLDENVLPRKKIHMVKFDRSKSGSRGGCDKYRSDTEVPIAIVNPTEWSRIDYMTPTMRKLIWGKEESRDCSKFADIERTPIIQCRMKCLSQFAITGKNCIENPLKSHVKLEMKLGMDSKTLKQLEQARFESIAIENDGKYDEIAITAEVEKISYAPRICKRRHSFKANGIKHEHVDRCMSGDIVIKLKCDSSADATVTLRQVTNGENDGQRIDLAICRQKGKTEGTCSRIIYEINSIIAVDSHVFQNDNEGYPKSGTLEDGRSYFIYRFLLFSDGFNTFQSRPGSMDGVYIVVLGIPTLKRNPASCIRKVCLCPPGTDVNHIIEKIIDDLMLGSTIGTAVRHNGKEIVIFLDLVGYIGDSPALASITGTKGHSSDIPCHLCTMKKNKDNTQHLKCFINQFTDSRNPALRRTAVRTDDIFNCAKSKKYDVCEQLGIRNENSSLKKVRYVLNEAKKNVPRSKNGHPVVSCLFDEYRSSMISPDHVFLGIGSNLLELTIKYLCPGDRDLLEAGIKYLVSSGKIPLMVGVLNSTGDGVGKLTISQVYSIIYVLPYAVRLVFKNKILKNEKDKRTNKENIRFQYEMQITKLVDSFCQLVQKCQYEPRHGISCESDVRWYDCQEGTKRLNDLLGSVEQFELKVQQLHETDPIRASILDKPNLHRLRELVVHTIPLFRNLKHIQELILEKGHQSAKKAIRMSNQKNSQLQAMNDALIEDLLNRLYSVTSSRQERDEFDTEEIEMLTDIFLERNSLDSVNDINLKTFENAFTKDLIEVLKDFASPIYNGDDYIWSCHHGKIKYRSDHENVLNDVKNVIEEWMSTGRNSENLHTEIHSICSLSLSSCDGKKFKTKMKLKAYEVIHVLTKWEDRKNVHQSSFNFCEYSGCGETEHLFCLGFILVYFEDETSKIYALCRRMCKLKIEHEWSLENTYRVEDGPFDTIIEMTSNVRISHAMHACWEEEEGCVNRNGNILHEKPILNGGKFVLNTLKEGYPPRSG